MYCATQYSNNVIQPPPQPPTNNVIDNTDYDFDYHVYALLDFLLPKAFKWFDIPTFR